MVYNLIVASSYVLAVTSFGAGLTHLVFGFWQVRSSEPLDSRRGEAISSAAWIGSAFILGQGVLSQLWVLLALFGWFTPQLVTGVLVLAALSGLRPAFAPAKALAVTLAMELLRLWQEPWYWKALAGCCVAVVLLSGVEGLVVPVPGGADAAANYMPLAKLTAAAHQLIPLPGGYGIAQLGLVGEMHWAALMALGMEGAGKVFSWPTALAGTLMLLPLGSTAGIGRRGQWILVAMVWTSSTVLVHVWDGKVDLFGAAAGIAAYYWVIRATQSANAGAIDYDAGPSVRGLCMVGLFTTLAVISKLTLLVAMVPGIILLLAWRTLIWPGRSSESAGTDANTGNGSLHVPIWFVLRSLLILAASGFAILWPQLLKNTVLFGEPLAPIFYFAASHRAELDGVVLTMADAYYIFSIYPLALVFGRFSNMGWTLSYLVLILLPLAMFLPRPRSLARSTLFQLTATGVAGIVAWHLFRPAVFAPRYMLPTLFLFTLAAAAAAEHISRLNEYRHRLLTGAMMVCVLFSLLFQARDFFVTDELLVRLSNEVRRRPNYPAYSEFLLASEVVNQDAGVGDRVLLGMYDCYWLRPDLIRTIGYPEASTPGLFSPADRWLVAYNQGYRYVLLEANTLPGKHIAAELGIMPDGSVKASPSNLRIETLYHDHDCTVVRIREVH